MSGLSQNFFADLKRIATEERSSSRITAIGETSDEIYANYLENIKRMSSFEAVKKLQEEYPEYKIVEVICKEGSAKGIRYRC